jgi:hypothetical protein
LAQELRRLANAVSEHDAGMLRYLDGLGIRRGADVLVTSRAPYEGRITLDVAEEVCVFGPALAARVLVTAPD